MILAPKRTTMMPLPLWIVVAITIIGISFVRILPTSFAFIAVDSPQRHHRNNSVTILSRSASKAITEIESAVSSTSTSTSTTETTEPASTTLLPSTDGSMQERKPFVIVPPNQGFRNTIGGGAELSIASMNLLAPFYNSLQLNAKTTSDYERWEFLDGDRRERVPVALNMAKRTNADVLCLQEIEGGKLGEIETIEGISRGEFTLRDDIRDWLAESTIIKSSNGTKTTILEGYDAFVWSPLNPNNKRGDVVGLCIAWRSQKHSLVEWEGYRRGMVCRLQDNNNHHDDNNKESSPASFALANLHLPARPSNVLGRLSTMSRTIRKLSELESNMQKDRAIKTASSNNSNNINTIDGLMVVAGDFNSDQNSVAARLLTHGYTNYGNVRDRNYKAKITKASASNMSHPYRFVDSYDHGDHENNKDPRFKKGSFRELYAPVTVSLKGRGPGIMDHLFYATGKSKRNDHRHPPKIQNARKNPSKVATKSSGASTVDALSISLLEQHLGGTKRTKRRKKGESRGGGGSEGVASAARYTLDPKARIQIDSVLATVNFEANDNGDEERLRIIREGLPNLEEGFPSDHLPVGALFSAVASSTSGSNKEDKTEKEEENPDKKSNTKGDTKAEVIAVLAQSQNLSTAVEDPTSSHDDDSNDDDDNHLSTVAHKTQKREPKGQRAGASTVSGISSSVQRRRSNSRTSYGLRRRHNLVLNTLTEWVVGRGATSIVLDKPLYKNELLARTLDPSQSQKLKKKSRAPDLVCIVVKVPTDANHTDNNADATTLKSSSEECMVVVEVAVASDPIKVRSKKQSKYKDLVELLSSNSKQRCCFAAIVVGDDGSIPDGTRADIRSLAQLTTQRSNSNSNPDSTTTELETDRLCTHLQSLVSSFPKQ
uniref:Endonuclease/exonuclease/phosphatase domain-containing protein n=1 Tax=Pseudo-nitzschia australis TaxID=44445 RepID=A0A7S4ACC9_9STRA